VARALESITPGRANVLARVQASGVQGNVRVVVELDPAAAKQPEWATGGTLQLSFEGERGGPPRTMTQPIPPGQRTVLVEGTEGGLAPGRYIVRAELRAAKGPAPIRASTDATVPQNGVTMGSAALALRRGPTTGLSFLPTADPRFRRTERIRLEVPLFGDTVVTPAVRTLTRDGQPLLLNTTVAERKADATGQRFIVADVILAPLAAGDYVLEVALDGTGGRDVASYGFRVVP
jgi:hypothetical protein